MMHESSLNASRLPKVVVDLEKLRHLNAGLGRFALHLGQELVKVAPGRFTPVLFLPPRADRYFKNQTYVGKPVIRWQKESLQRSVRPLVQPFLKPSDISLWHATNQHSKYLPLDGRVPVLLTIHDLNFLRDAPHNLPTERIDRQLADVQAKVDRAAAITTVSAFVAEDVRSHVNLRGKPIHVVHNGMPPPPAASTVRPDFLPAGPFLYTVGNCLAHKNFHVLIDLLEHLPGRRLVIAGRKTTPYGQHLENLLRQKSITDRVIMPGEVSDGDRQWLYEHCEAFLFPSLTEGFGFPVLEAMQCGKPVFMSRATSLPEIGGDCGFYFDSYDGPNMAGVFAAGMKLFQSDPTFPDRCRRRADSFTWRNAAEKYAALYEAICMGPAAALLAQQRPGK